MTLQQAFESYRERLEITKKEQDEAKKTHEDVRAKLRATELKVVRDFLGGSYRRATKNRPLKDIDLYVVLEREAYEGSDMGTDPVELLSFLKRIVSKTWEDEEVVVQRCSVSLDLSHTDFGFDIVPAFEESGDGLLFIPDRKLGEWRRTNPEEHIRLLSVANQQAGKKLVPLIKMLKSWNREKNKAALKSFWIESRAMEIFDAPIESYPEAIAGFLESISDTHWGPCSEPVGVGPPIEPLRSSIAEGEETVRARISIAANDARSALAVDNDDDAVLLWYEIMGYPFPKGAKKLKQGAVVTVLEDLTQRIKNPARPWMSRE